MRNAISFISLSLSIPLSLFFPPSLSLSFFLLGVPLPAPPVVFLSDQSQFAALVSHVFDQGWFDLSLCTVRLSRSSPPNERDRERKRERKREKDSQKAPRLSVCNYPPP